MIFVKNSVAFALATTLAGGLLLSTMAAAGSLVSRDAPRYSSAQQSHQVINQHRQHGQIVHAQVIGVKPVYQTVQVSQPQRHCWRQKVIRPVAKYRHSSHRSHRPHVVARAGGVKIGSNYRYRKHSRHYSRSHARSHSRLRHSTNYYFQKRCRVVNHVSQQQQFQGYHVRYRYNGQIYTTLSSRRPGNSIPIQVSIAPAW